MGLLSWLKGGTPAARNPDWNQLWSTCTVDQSRVTEIANICKKILDNKARYDYVSLHTNVPWYLIAALHYREASLNFRTCLHNGDPLPGPTTHVPRGRGPFKTWEEAAIDALKYDGLNQFTYGTIIPCLIMAEKYNGLGMRKKGKYSPYVWAGTNQSDETGKYVSDGIYNPLAKEKQLGVAAIFKGLGL
jgi:lysozyme family protein